MVSLLTTSGYLSSTFKTFIAFINSDFNFSILRFDVLHHKLKKDVKVLIYIFVKKVNRQISNAHWIVFTYIHILYIILTQRKSVTELAGGKPLPVGLVASGKLLLSGAWVSGKTTVKRGNGASRRAGGGVVDGAQGTADGQTRTDLA